MKIIDRRSVNSLGNNGCSVETEKRIYEIILTFALGHLLVSTVANFPVDSKFPLLQADYMSIIATELAGMGLTLRDLYKSFVKKPSDELGKRHL